MVNGNCNKDGDDDDCDSTKRHSTQHKWEGLGDSYTTLTSSTKHHLAVNHQFTELISTEPGSITYNIETSSGVHQLGELEVHRAVLEDENDAVCRLASCLDSEGTGDGAGHVMANWDGGRGDPVQQKHSLHCLAKLPKSYGRTDDLRSMKMLEECLDVYMDIPTRRGLHIDVRCCAAQCLSQWQCHHAPEIRDGELDAQEQEQSYDIDEDDDDDNVGRKLKFGEREEKIALESGWPGLSALMRHYRLLTKCMASSGGSRHNGVGNQEQRSGDIGEKVDRIWHFPYPNVFANGLLYQLQLSLLRAVSQVKDRSGRIPALSHKWLFRILSRNDNGQNLVMALRSRVVYKRKDPFTSSTSSSTSSSSISSSANSRSTSQRIQLPVKTSSLYTDVNFIGTLLCGLTATLQTVQQATAMRDMLMYYLNYDRAYPSPRFRLSEICIQCMANVESAGLLSPELFGFPFEEIWAEHLSPRIRKACLNAIVHVYCKCGAGHSYKTLLKLLVSSSPQYELGSKLNRWSLISRLNSLDSKTFWYGIFRDNAYIKGISNQLWQ